MLIKDTWEIHDAASRLKIKVVIEEGWNRLHIEYYDRATAQQETRDFYFTKDGKFDGMGYDLSRGNSNE